MSTAERVPNSNLDRLAIAHIAVLIALTVGIAAADIRMIEARGLFSEAIYPIQTAADILATGSWPATAFYPPLVTGLALAIQASGVHEIDPYIFNLIFLVIGLLPAYALARTVLLNGWGAFAACALMLINPYFVWTVLLVRDAATEFLFLGIVLWSCAKLCMDSSPRHPARWLAFILITAAVLLSLARVTGFFMSLGVLAVAYLVTEAPAIRRLILGSTAALLAFGLLWAYANFLTVGAFALATNGGYNLYLGNHPAFLHGYPHYDIDVFLQSQDVPERRPPGEAALNDLYTREALDFIRADPAAFAYRTIMKSAWYWFSLDKLPNYSTDARVTSPSSETEWTAQLGRVSIVSSLAYVLYRLAYLPALIASWIAIYRRQIDRRLAIVFAPLFGLWPVVALTFPDTRFKLSAEALTMPVVIAGAWAIWMEFRSRKVA